MGLVLPCRANCDQLRARQTQLERQKTEAALADAVYNRGGTMNLPPGYSRVTDRAELAKLNLSPEMLTPPGYKPDKNNAPFAAVFRNDTTGEYTVAFKGTSSGADWKQNAQQGIGLPTSYYTQAEAIGSVMAFSPMADKVKIVGHSLGGGLASAASRASGLPATTFNAAGLHKDTIASPRPSQIEAVYVRGELLRTAQMAPGAPQAIGTAQPLDPPTGIGKRALTGLAAGLAATGSPWLAGGVAAYRGYLLHGMDSVGASLDQALTQTKKTIEKCC